MHMKQRGARLVAVGVYTALVAGVTIIQGGTPTNDGCQQLAKPKAIVFDDVRWELPMAVDFSS